MDYGLFDFDTNKVLVSEAAVDAPWKLGQKDEKFPWVPLIPHPAGEQAVWTQATWAFYCRFREFAALLFFHPCCLLVRSWADQGSLFYYWYILRAGEAGIVNADDQDHELVHFIGVHKREFSLARVCCD